MISISKESTTFFTIGILLTIIFKLDKIIIWKKKPMIKKSLLINIMSIYSIKETLIWKKNKWELP